jgi:hypothetical protein
MKLILQRKCHGIGSWAVDQVHGGQLTGPRHYHWMMAIGDKIDGPDLITGPVWAGSNLSRTREIRWRRAVSLTRGVGAGTPVRWLPSLRRTAGRSSALSLPMVWRLESFGLKWCRGIWDTHPRFNHGGEWLQGGRQRWLNLLGFDGGARPHPSPSDPKDGFLSFLVLSSRSFPGPIALGGDELVLATSASSSRVQSKAGRNLGAMAAYL